MIIKAQDITLGMTASYEHDVTIDDIDGFAALSGDENPIHIDDDYASKTQFGKRIAHGFFTASFFSAIFGTQLPGPGCMYIAQSLKFRRPVFVGDRVIAEVKVIKINTRKKTVLFETTCSVEGKKVTTGEGEIFIPDLGKNI